MPAAPISPRPGRPEPTMSPLTNSLAAISFLTVAAVSAADERSSSEPPASTAPIEATIARLGSPERAERTAAEAELLRRGPDALDLLPREESVADAAVRAA